METMEARFKRGFEKLMMPFLSPQMWIDGPLSHQINVRDSLVAEIDKARGESNTITDLMNQIGKTVVPGTIMDMYEVVSSASKGEVYDRGRITRPQTALIKQITGTNIIEVDPVELFKKALGVHKAAERDITGDFEKVFANSGGQQVTEKELREAASEISPRLEQMSAEARGTYIGLKSLIGSREAFNVLAERINEKGSATGSIQWWNNIDQNRVNTPFTSEKIMKLVDRIKEADIRSQQVEEGKPETGIRFKIFNEYLGEINKGMGQGGSYINPAETAIPE